MYLDVLIRFKLLLWEEWIWSEMFENILERKRERERVYDVSLSLSVAVCVCGREGERVLV